MEESPRGVTFAIKEQDLPEQVQEKPQRGRRAFRKPCHVLATKMGSHGHIKGYFIPELLHEAIFITPTSTVIVTYIVCVTVHLLCRAAAR